MAFELSTEDCEKLDKDLADFLSLSEAQSAMLCDRGGAVLFKSGDLFEGTQDLISALVAGSFAATKELAAVLGEEEFTAIFHQGVSHSIFISAVGEEVLLLAIFSENTNAGLVKMYAQNTCRKMQSLFSEILGRENRTNEDQTATFVLNKGNIFGDN